MKKSTKKKRGKAESGSTAIHFNKDDRKRLGWLQKRLGGLTLAGVVKMAVAALYAREQVDKAKSLAEVGRMSQELRGDLFKLPPQGLSALGGPISPAEDFNPNVRTMETPEFHAPHPADALQSDIRQRVEGEKS
jgi:hypothetical protein